jgi:hypothetical protein
VDVNLVARLRNGITIQGGTSTGRKLQDACAERAALPELGAGASGLSNNAIAGTAAGNSTTSPLSVVNPYCHVVEPYLTQYRGLMTYTIPKAGLQVSTTWSSIPGTDLAANYTINSAIAGVGPQPLGRNLSATDRGLTTVNLITPATMYAPRRNNLDFRIAKIMRFGGTRTQVGVDVYNATNTDTPTTFNQGYTGAAGSWLTPTAIQPARYARISAQFEF